MGQKLSIFPTRKLPSAIAWSVPSQDLGSGLATDAIETMEVDGCAPRALLLPWPSVGPQQAQAGSA